MKIFEVSTTKRETVIGKITESIFLKLEGVWQILFLCTLLVDAPTRIVNIEANENTLVKIKIYNVFKMPFFPAAGGVIIPRQGPATTTTAARKNPFELLIAVGKLHIFIVSKLNF